MKQQTHMYYYMYLPTNAHEPAIQHLTDLCTHLVLTLSQHLLFANVVDPQEPADAHQHPPLKWLHCHGNIINGSLGG